MQTLDYYLHAIRSGAYKRVDWIRAAFCLIQEAPEAYKEDPYPYRIVQQTNGVFFINPEKEYNLEKIDDATVGQELLKPGMRISLSKDSLENVGKDLETTVGNVLLNAIVLIYPFGKLFPFQEGKVNVKQIEKLILAKLEDDPKDPTERKPGHLYVQDYLKYTEAMGLIREIVDIFVPGASKGSMTPPPGVVEYRNKLLKENADRLSDPAVVADIDAKLVEYDKAYLKDDDDAQGFMLSPKMQKEVRRKLFLTVGGQSGMSDGVETTLVPNSLSEGNDVSLLPVLNSTARAGSYNRGHQTMNGGAQFKRTLRAASNSSVTVHDCGTKVGKPIIIPANDKDAYLGFSVITPKGTVELTEENISQYLNQVVQLRSPQYCKAEKTDYCQVCSGKRLSLHPTAVAVAVSDIGSTFLYLFLKKMHVSGMDNVKLDIMSSLS